MASTSNPYGPLWYGDSSAGLSAWTTSTDPNQGLCDYANSLAAQQLRERMSQSQRVFEERYIYPYTKKTFASFFDELRNEVDSWLAVEVNNAKG